MVHSLMAFATNIAHLHFLHLQVGHLPLGAKELSLLLVLVEARGRVVSRSELRQRVALGSDRRCDDLLVNVRRALGPEAVRNVRRRGWRLDVSALTPDRG